MTPARGERVYALFEAVLNCDPRRRVALIKELSGDDPQLGAEVERLLAQDAEAERDRFLATPAPTERDAERHDRSNDGNSGFSLPPSLEETNAETPIPAAAPPPGLAEHPDYVIKRELGRGGMGVVYLAENRLMGRHEVLKVMGRQIMERPEVLERFLREIRAVAKLSHPDIVTAYHAVRLGESIVFAMEYVDGLDLSRIVKARGPLPVSIACNYVRQAALGLQHAHEHRSGTNPRRAARRHPRRYLQPRCYPVLPPDRRPAVSGYQPLRYAPGAPLGGGGAALPGAPGGAG